MRAIFSSKFPPVNSIANSIAMNSLIVNKGKKTYCDFLPLMERMDNFDNESCFSIHDLYKEFGIDPFGVLSKRYFYSKYKNGIVVGAGSGEDCIDLICDDNWHLFDLTDLRMINQAVSYDCGLGEFNVTSTNDGNTIVGVSDKYKIESRVIEFVSIDSFDFSICDLISIDAEGSALDVLAGAVDTITRHSPDILVSIYHNWTEYLLIIPFLFDMGYEIDVIKTSNFMPQQPHLELTLLCKKPREEVIG